MKKLLITAASAVLATGATVFAPTAHAGPPVCVAGTPLNDACTSCVTASVKGTVSDRSAAYAKCYGMTPAEQRAADDPCKVPVIGEYCDHPVQIPVQQPQQ
jgi:hypothetical protein